MATLCAIGILALWAVVWSACALLDNRALKLRQAIALLKR